MINKDTAIANIEKAYKTKIALIQQSIYQEIKYILSTQFSQTSIEGSCILEINDGQKFVVIKNSDIYNFLTKLGLYPIATENKKFIISNNSIKTDAASINKRVDFIKSSLNAEINSNAAFKTAKIDFKKMSDEEISALKKSNKEKEDLHKKIIDVIKTLKLSSAI